jgi:poly-gamma-glutamate synthesis protein (capsule biosynthesis protein)
MLCFYSLGNFVSNQREKDRILGGMMVVTLTKEELNRQTEKLLISNHGLIPVVTHYDRDFSNTKVYPMYSYTEDHLGRHHMRQVDRNMNFEYFNSVLHRLNVKLVMPDRFLAGSW